MHAYRDFTTIPTDGGALPGWIPNPRRVRAIAREAWEREQLRCAINRRNGAMTFYRTHPESRRWIGFAQVPMRPGRHDAMPADELGDVYLNLGRLSWVHETPGVNLVDEVCRWVRLGKRHRQTKANWKRWREGDERIRQELEFDARQEEERHELLEEIIHREERRGMGRHFRKSHLIERNPLAK